MKRYANSSTTDNQVNQAAEELRSYKETCLENAATSAISDLNHSNANLILNTFEVCENTCERTFKNTGLLPTVKYAEGCNINIGFKGYRGFGEISIPTEYVESETGVNFSYPQSNDYSAFYNVFNKEAIQYLLRLLKNSLKSDIKLDRNFNFDSYVDYAIDYFINPENIGDRDKIKSWLSDALVATYRRNRR